MGMNKAVRIGAVVAAVGLVGYAAFSLSRREPRTVSGTSDEAPAKRARANAGKTRDASSASKAGADAKVRDAKAGTSATVGGPVPVPQDVDFEKSLDDLESFVKDLESMHARKIKLPQPEWVEKYKRGNDLVDVLMRTDEVKRGDGPRKEVTALNMRFRAIIQDVLMPPA